MARYSRLSRRVKQGGKPGLPRFKSKKNNHRCYKSKNAAKNILAEGLRLLSA